LLFISVWMRIPGFIVNEAVRRKILVFDAGVVQSPNSWLRDPYSGLFRCRPRHSRRNPDYLFRSALVLVEHYRMRRILIVLVVWLFSSLLWAHPHTKKSNPAPADPLYCSALAAANRFLHAWQTQDHEAAIMMLSDSARQRTSPELLQEFFSPTPQAAYEIERGRKLSATEYMFPAVLFGSSKTSSPHTARIILELIGKDDWVISQLP
jgi:hypothetical protein